MLRPSRMLAVPLLALALGLVYFTSPAQEKTSKHDFDMTARYIEACSCDMFCPCYFNDHSTNHMAMAEHPAEEHSCPPHHVLKVDTGSSTELRSDRASV